MARTFYGDVIPPPDLTVKKPKARFRAGDSDCTPAVAMLCCVTDLRLLLSQPVPEIRGLACVLLDTLARRPHWVKARDAPHGPREVQETRV